MKEAKVISELILFLILKLNSIQFSKVSLCASSFLLQSFFVVVVCASFFASGVRPLTSHVGLFELAFSSNTS